MLGEPYLDHCSKRCQRGHTVIKDFGGTVKNAAKLVVLWIDIALPPKKAKRNSMILFRCRI